MKKRMPYIAAAFLFVLIIICFTGCGSDGEKTEITILAAASMTDALDEIITEYEKENDCVILASYAGSGELMQQIEGGAPCNIFISASVANMDQLEAEGYLAEGSRTDLVTNTLTLIASAEMKDKVRLDNLSSDEITTIAIGEPETVPAGRYAMEVLENLAAASAVEEKTVYAKDVRAVLNYVETGDADCGFVYKTDAMLLNEKKGVIICDVDSSLHGPIVYPAALIAGAGENREAEDFFRFLQSSFAQDVFEKYGFTVK